MPVVPYSRFPLADRDMSWSFTAADGNRLIESGGWALFKRVHTWFDDSEGNTPENKGAYKLPHHKYVGDVVKTVWRGVAAAMAALKGARGGVDIPSADRRGVYNHLARHYREFDEEPPELDRIYEDYEFRELLERWGFDEFEIEEMMENYQPKNEEQLSIESYNRPFGMPTDKQLEKINALAKRPLKKEEVFVFHNKMIGDKLIEERNLKIHKSLLEVFREDAKSGIAFMLDHPWASSGLFGMGGRPRTAYAYGRSFDAVLKKGDIEGETWALYGDFYIVRNRVKEGINTNDIIADIEDGVLFDTSIGYGADTLECSICGNDIRDAANCEHLPGRMYDGERCYIIVKPPGYLMENSGVFDGAYESAGILSVTGETISVSGGIIPVTDFKSLRPDKPLFHIYSAARNRLATFMRRDDLEARKTMFTVTDTMKGGMGKLSDVKVNICDGSGNVLETLTISNELTNINVEQFAKYFKTEAYLNKQDVVEFLGKEMPAVELLKYAKEGEAYLSALRQEAKEWGIRAKGDEFNAEAWEARFAVSDSKELKNFIETFKVEAEAVIPAGRQTDPRSKALVGKESDIPDEAFKA